MAIRYLLLNSAVIPAPGLYSYRLISQEAAAAWLQVPGWQSRIGYPETARHIQEIAGVLPAISRDRTELAVGDQALVVRLSYRLTDPGQKAGYRPEPDDWEYGLLARLPEPDR